MDKNIKDARKASNKKEIFQMGFDTIHRPVYSLGKSAMDNLIRGKSTRNFIFDPKTKEVLWL